MDYNNVVKRKKKEKQRRLILNFAMNRAFDWMLGAFAGISGVSCSVLPSLYSPCAMCTTDGASVSNRIFELVLVKVHSVFIFKSIFKKISFDLLWTHKKRIWNSSRMIISSKYPHFASMKILGKCSFVPHSCFRI